MTIEAKAIEKFLDAATEPHGGTWRNWIKAVLVNLQAEGEGFSGKRPLGDSGWEYQLACGLCDAGLVEHFVENDDWGEATYEFAWGDVSDAWIAVVDHLLR